MKKVYVFPNTGSYEITIGQGIYFFQCWGSKGASSPFYENNQVSVRGGYGGYSAGIYFNTIHNLTLYVNVGGIGTSSNTSSCIGGFNGGGSGGTHGACGGGATDIRLNEDLNSRIIVAGGGGGANGGTRQVIGGDGGGDNGVQGRITSDTSKESGQSCYGTQNGCIGASENYSVAGTLGEGGGSYEYHYSGGGGGCQQY